MAIKSSDKSGKGSKPQKKETVQEKKPAKSENKAIKPKARGK
jgi:hypothetical protein